MEVAIGNGRVLTLLQQIAELQNQLNQVNAENEQDALLKAQEIYRNEEVVLYSDDCIDTKFNIFKYG